MRIIRSFLAVVITLSLVAGYSSVQTKKTVSAATANKTITVKASSDFTLKLPRDWKGNYKMKCSKGKKHGSYVAFYSKKCYKQKKEGWLFTIMRYKDDSYTDMPSYELVGKWNGLYYVALFPTDVQTEGVTKAAKKQYDKLNHGSLTAAASLQPVKNARKGKGVFRVSDFSLKLPDNWKGNYIVKQSKKKKHGSYVAFYAKKCYKQKKLGWLFSIARYKDDSYQEIPAYELVGKWNGYYYVVLYPTDVQYEGVTKAAKKQYTKLNKSVEKVVRSIWP
ncbi:MAG: hypothetical protein J1F22_02140 [Lachnospiraceae bacterium]|nr:hypothetical protein [Lachnospiraceae bacterium]